MLRNKLASVLVLWSYLTAFAVGPYTHLLHGHEETATPVGKYSFVEFCGGVDHPCSHKDHDHASRDPSHHFCPICKVTATTSPLLVVSHVAIPESAWSGWAFSAMEMAQPTCAIGSHPTRAPPIL